METFHRGLKAALLACIEHISWMSKANP